MTAIGELKHRLVLEEPVEAPDGAGGFTRSYAAVATLWAALTPVSARGEADAAALGSTVTHRIVIRARAGLTTRHRFRLGARVFRIVALNARADGRFHDIHAEERGD